MVYGRLAGSTDTKLTFLLDGKANDLKNVDQVQETFFFENPQICNDLIE
jgi:hypothetical protein